MNAVKHTNSFLLFEGIAFIILGVIAIAAPVAFTLGIELLIGWLFIISGLVQGYRALFRERSWPVGLSALAYLVIGVLFVAYPLTGALSLTLLLMIFFFIEGIAKIGWSFQLRAFRNWGWLLFSGILSLIMGGIIFAGLPGTALWVVGLLVGINMIFLGISLLALNKSFI